MLEIFIIGWLLCFQDASAFYVPGVAPYEFLEGEEIFPKVC
jgi:hypothetical protein